MKVSILIPTYNRCKVLGHALESALGQTHHNVEAVVYDDGSTDKTLKFMAGLKDPRIRYIRDVDNRGVGAARNRLLAEAKTQYACWLDSDDMCNRWRVDLMLFAIRQTGAPFVRSAFSLFGHKHPGGWKTRPELKARRQYAAATAIFDVAKARQIKYREDIQAGEDTLWEKEFVLAHGPGRYVPLNLYLVGRGSRLYRLTQAYRTPARRGRAKKSEAIVAQELDRLVEALSKKGYADEASRFPPWVDQHALDVMATKVGLSKWT